MEIFLTVLLVLYLHILIGCIVSGFVFELVDHNEFKLLFEINYYTILSGTYIGGLMGRLVRSIFRLTSNPLSKIHKFLCTNPLDLFKFSIKIERSK